MYEAVTFESILQRMLDRVPDDMDKREGSVIYDALAPAAVELQLMYIELDVILRDTFADTAMDRDLLVLRAAERGIKPGDKTKASVKGVIRPASLDIPIGSRFSCGLLNYEAKEKIEDGIYCFQCESAGSEANGNTGQMIPIDYISGLESAELTELLIPGEDAEPLESIRERYFKSFESEAFGGNKADYIKKCDTISGVGPVRVTSAWNGGGTVKLTILDSACHAATETLLRQVQEIFDPSGDGKGDGLAPIGHVVTVDTAEEAAIDVSSVYTFEDGYDFETLKAAIREAINAYFGELRNNWAETVPIVRVSQIEARILGIKGILDITATKLNGVEENLKLSPYQIPVTGGVISE